MIDWFTVGAQIVNFLILVGLLRYFLYGRILDAIDRRQARLQAEWKEARTMRALAEEELEGARREHEQLAARKEELLARVKQEVEEFRGERLQEVREEIDRMRQRWADTLAEEQEAFFREMRREVASSVLAIARRVLAELADAELERLVVLRFIETLRQADESTRKRLSAALREGPPAVTVRSGFPVDPELQADVTQAVHAVLGGGVELQWEVSPELLCGLALHTDDEKLAWDFRDELDAIEHELQQTIEEEIRSHRRAVAPKESVP